MTTMAISETDFRTVLGSFASGVVVVTGTSSGEPRGLACQSFVSLSLAPQLVAVAINRTSVSWPEIERSGAFCANVLSTQQVEICKAFARSGGDKFFGLDWAPGTTGSPRLAASLAWIECTIEAVHLAGDHLLVIGAVRDIEVGLGHPLLFYRGEFGRMHDTESPATDRGRS